MSSGEVACTYACLILHDDGIPITADKIAAVVKAANVTVESYWPSLFAKLCEKKNIGDLIMNVGSAGASSAPVAVAAPSTADGDVAPATEEKKKDESMNEESDDEPLFNLFD